MVFRLVAVKFVINCNALVLIYICITFAARNYLLRALWILLHFSKIADLDCLDWRNLFRQTANLAIKITEPIDIFLEC